MLLDADQCYKALCTHDTRFDGRFFVGVGTTGVYCRPVCTARTPLKRNCRFFPSAAAARAELAPGFSRIEPARSTSGIALLLESEHVRFAEKLFAPNNAA